MIWITLFAPVATRAQRTVRNCLVARGAVNVWNAIVYLFHLLVWASTALLSTPVCATNRSITEFLLTWYAFLLCAYVYLTSFIACCWQVLDTLEIGTLITVPAMVIERVWEFRCTFFFSHFALTLLIYNVAIRALQTSISKAALWAIVDGIWARCADLIFYSGRFFGEIHIYGLISKNIIFEALSCAFIGTSHGAIAEFFPARLTGHIPASENASKLASGIILILNALFIRALLAISSMVIKWVREASVANGCISDDFNSFADFAVLAQREVRLTLRANVSTWAIMTVSNWLIA